MAVADDRAAVVFAVQDVMNSTTDGLNENGAEEAETDDRVVRVQLEGGNVSARHALTCIVLSAGFRQGQRRGPEVGLRHTYLLRIIRDVDTRDHTGDDKEETEALNAGVPPE